MLLTQLVFGTIVSGIARFLAALIASKTQKTTIRRHSSVTHGHRKGSDVVAVCPDLVSRYLYRDATSDGHRGREADNHN